jgi:hypothetical protein
MISPYFSMDLDFILILIVDLPTDDLREHMKRLVQPNSADTQVAIHAQA